LGVTQLLPERVKRMSRHSSKSEGGLIVKKNANKKQERRITKHSMANIGKFFGEVKQEARKVVWPTRKETTVSTITVLILVILASLFFMLVDGVISTLVEWILGFGG
jgi:preprotein translocase subunit SecE